MKPSRTLLLLAAAGLLSGCMHSVVTPGLGNNIPPGSSAPDPDAVDPHAPVAANTHFAAGQLAEAAGNLPHAVEQFQAALKIDPNHAPSLLQLALLLTAQRQYPPAIDLWHRYITATHDSAAAYNDLALCLDMAGRTPEAELAYTAGIAHDPMNQPCRVNYGLMLARLNRTTEAAAQLAMVLTPAEVHYDLASVLESQHHPTAAKSQYEQAISLDPDLTDAKTRLAGLETN